MKVEPTSTTENNPLVGFPIKLNTADYVSESQLAKVLLVEVKEPEIPVDIKNKPLFTETAEVEAKAVAQLRTELVIVIVKEMDEASFS